MKKVLTPPTPLYTGLDRISDFIKTRTRLSDMFCPLCRAEYRDGFTQCSDCHVGLVRSAEEARSASARDQVSSGDLSYKISEAVPFVVQRRCDSGRTIGPGTRHRKMESDRAGGELRDRQCDFWTSLGRRGPPGCSEPVCCPARRGGHRSDHRLLRGSCVPVCADRRNLLICSRGLRTFRRRSSWLVRAARSCCRIGGRRKFAGHLPRGILAGCDARLPEIPY